MTGPGASPGRSRFRIAATGLRRPRRSILSVGAVALALYLAAASLAVPSAAVAPSGADVELTSIHAAIGDLEHEFFHSVASSDVLSSAWTAARTAAKQSGAQVDRVPAPKLDGRDADALTSFDAAYRALNLAAGQRPNATSTIGHAAIAGIASSVHENHTYFIDPDHWSHREDTSTHYAGIGITLAQHDGGFYVTEVYAGSPAATAGLRPGDRFGSIGGVAVDGTSMDQLVSRLRGAPDTHVTVEVVRGGGFLLADLTRSEIVVPAFEARVLDGGVGYLQLRSFPPAGAKLPNGRTLGQALSDALDGFDQAGATAWVLDLRGNGGGYLDAMIEVAGQFLPVDTPIWISRTQGGDRVTKTAGGEHATQKPLVVLVNGGSASASEILTAALQENARAAVAGDRSAGVANAANLDALPDGGGLSITSVQSLTPMLHRPLDGSGVLPDVPVAGSDADIALGRDRQLEHAVSIALAGGAQAASSAR
ncbi:MAG: S41 family peptidase [Dehalococcoidia bacterium]